MSLNMDIVNETKQAFEAFKAANDERLKKIEQKFEDPLFDGPQSPLILIAH